MSLQDDVSEAWWKPGPRMKSAARTALDLLFPPQSLDDGPRPLATGLTAPGWSQITFLADPVCDGCGTPFEYSLGEGVRCAACLAKPRAFARARAACLYDDASRGPILQLKHADRTDLAPPFRPLDQPLGARPDRRGPRHRPGAAASHPSAGTPL
ncbi:hypothetical protein [Phenylobacterium sp.]|uniref:hypothetical protein n=1 Tax=Phenylobacterium sp. TaxID=1871053 RepID=UPI00351F24FC